MRDILLLKPRIVKYPDDITAVSLVWLDSLGKDYFSNYSIFWGMHPKHIEPMIKDWKKNKIRVPVANFQHGQHYYFQVWAEHPEGDGIIISNIENKHITREPEMHFEDILEKRAKIFGKADLFG